MSLRVLLLVPHPFFVERGSPIADRAVLEALREEGHRVDVLTYHLGHDPGVEGTDILRIPEVPGVSRVAPGFSWQKVVCDALLFASLLRRIRDVDYDVIHAVEESVYFGWLLRQTRGTPYVYDMDSALIDQLLESAPYLRPLGRFLTATESVAIRGSAAVLTICPALADRVRSLDDGTPVRVVEDASLLHGDPDDLPSPEDVRELGAGKAVMYVGNLAPYQGVGLLLDAFLHVADSHPEAHLVVVGGGERLQELRDRAGESRAADRIHFIGPRPISELGSHLGAADILVSPRLTGDNTPMKIYSYLDSGRPLVATSIRAHTQVLDESIARLTDPEPAALAAAIGELLEDEEAAAGLAARARDVARRNYTREAQRRKVKSFYREIVRSVV